MYYTLIVVVTVAVTLLALLVRIGRRRLRFSKRTALVTEAELNF